MRKKDDDGLREASSSSSDYFKADKGKLEQLQRDIAQEEGKRIDVSKAQLKSGADLQKLKQDVSEEEEIDVAEQHGEEQHEKREALRAFGTKTRHQEEERSTVTAQEKPTPESVIERSEEASKRQEQSGQEYQQQAG